MVERRRHSSVRDWLHLLRAPNLLTVPGDPLAGFLLAAGQRETPDIRLLLVVVAAVMFYAAGLVMNDLFDRAVDQRERPTRPLVAGRIHSTAARIAMAVCFIGGVALCAAAGRSALIAALFLMSAITGYNLLHRAGPAAGLLMGLCRGLNVMLGAALVAPWDVRPLAAVLLIGSFIVALTALARHEMSEARPAIFFLWLPAVVILAGFAVFERLADLPREMEFRMAGSFFFAFALAGLAAWRLQQGGAKMAPGSIGILISALIPLQVALCLAAGVGVWSLAAAFVLMLCWPLNRWLARIFAPS